MGNELEIRTGIRMRLFTIEKTLVRCLGEDRVGYLRQETRKRLERNKETNRERSGILKPTITVKDLYEKIESTPASSGRTNRATDYM